MQIKTSIPDFVIKKAKEQDIPVILNFIKELAEYEKLSHDVIATEAGLRQTLFCEKPYAEVLIGYFKNEPVGFALFFHNYSTFLGRPGIYLEDLYVNPKQRGKGFGKELMLHVARIAKERNCGRFEWAVLDWNAPAIQFYKSLGAVPMAEWTIFRVTADKLDKLVK